MESCLNVMMRSWINELLLLVALVLLSIVPCQCQSHNTPTEGTVTIFMSGNIVVPPVVSVIEGDTLRLHCLSDILNSSIQWTKPGNPDFYRNTQVLNIERVLLDHAGQYTCNVLDQSGETITNLTGISNFNVNVLYGPGIVTITGPNSALTLETVELTCSSTGNPQPSYLWTRSGSGLPVLQRGPILMGQIGESDVTYYCFAENTLIPTQGNSTTSSAVVVKTINRHRETNIYDLYDNYNVNEGDRLDIVCLAVGNPPARVYWTRVGNETIINEGSRLLVPNVKMDFEGYYSCHAENTVTNAKGVGRLVTHKKNTYIQVHPKGTLSGDEVCATKCNVTSATLYSDVVCAAKCNVTSDKASLQPTIKEHCNHVVIAALVIGWIVVLILFLIGLFYCIRVREAREVPWSKHHKSEDQMGTSLVQPSTSKSSSSRSESPKRPDLPKRPELPESPRRLEPPNRPVTTGRLDSPKRPVSGVSTHTYLALNDSTSDRGTPDGNNSTPAPAAHSAKTDSDFGYITAKFSTCDNAGYEKPMTSSETPNEANNEDTKLKQAVESV